MSQRPPYFDKIRENAARRWTQLEGDPELAGPWHQLFAQVQSPRHVLSELLQNADDAGATTASVRFEGNAFVFSHNGEDFAEEHFASLCRFGYSNKRALHTIGFRGIGFKSTFSLGDKVELRSPTLSVAFRRARFTEPVWLGEDASSDPRTHIRVELKDGQRRTELEKNLQEWLKSPYSLVFFRNIRHIKIGEKEIRWTHLRPGPVPNTEWMALNGSEEDAFLVARSEPEAFPAEALAEIRNERLLTSEQDVEFPPCRVEIVLGAPGRLYVVLPTGVETQLPFACNAPFIQDPARFKIKPPETSPTNRWLLDRAGKLAASVMQSWLQAGDLTVAERAEAYALMPDVDGEDFSPEGTCAAIVQGAFSDAIEGENILLTDSGRLVAARRAISYPRHLLDVWPEEVVSNYFDVDKRPALARDVSHVATQTLQDWELISSCNRDHVFTVLQRHALPRPQTWASLLRLWDYVESMTQSYSYRNEPASLRIVPVQGASELFAPTEVARIGERKLLQSESDWAFLSSYLRTVDGGWIRFLSELAPQGRQQTSAREASGPQAALALLDRIGLGSTSEIGKIIEQAALTFFRQQRVNIPDCIRFAQICAKLNIVAGKFLRYVTQDNRLHAPDDGVVFDVDGTLQDLLSEAWQAGRLLHNGYSEKYQSCTAEEWKQWFLSGRSGLDGFPRLKPKRTSLFQRAAVVREIERRGGTGKPTYGYVTNQFIVEDWDFDEELWRYWHFLAKEDERVWGRIAEALMRQPESFWSKAMTARIVQIATTGTTRSVYYDTLQSDWILKFRELPCLPDTRGFFHKPADLTRRTPETEPLLDVEPFVGIRFDQESTRPLLVALGVRDTPTGPEHLISRLRALSKSAAPPISEVEKWYRRLDQMVAHGSTVAVMNIRVAFGTEALVFTEQGEWVTARAVFLNADEEDVPGAATIRGALRDLMLWSRVGVAERPTAELAIQWLSTLPSGEPLPPKDQKRVRALLARHAVRIWDECQHWLSLGNEWVPVEELRYSVAMRSLVAWEHLHDWVKRETGDFRQLPVDLLDTVPFSNLPTLAEHIEDRFDRSPRLLSHPRFAPWMTSAGSTLTRIQLATVEETERVRGLAEELANTRWFVSPGLQTVSYVKGVPAGVPRRTPVVWTDRTLYTEDLPTPKLARLVPDVLGKTFMNADIVAALNYSFGRSVDDVVAYLEENFNLADEQPAPIPADDHAHPATPFQAKAAVASEDGELPELSAETSRLENPEVDRVPADGDSELTALLETPSNLSLRDPEGDDEGDSPAPAPRRATSNSQWRPNKQDIIERFAMKAGFQRVDSQRFRHADGSTLAKDNCGVFNWERRTRSGEVVRYYWAKDHCLQDEALQVEAALWSLIDAQPDTHALILADPQGGAIEVSGAALKRMREEGHLGIYPATYRLAMRNDLEVASSE